MIPNRQFKSKQCPVRDYLSVGIIAHDPGRPVRPVRDVFRDCHGRSKITIAEQKAHQNKIATTPFVYRPAVGFDVALSGPSHSLRQPTPFDYVNGRVASEP